MTRRRVFFYDNRDGNIWFSRKYLRDPFVRMMLSELASKPIIDSTALRLHVSAYSQAQPFMYFTYYARASICVTLRNH